MTKIVTKMRTWALAGLLLLFAIACKPSSAETRQKIRVGFMICNSEAETRHRFEALTAYLERELEVDVEMVTIDTVDFENHVADLDFTHTNSLLYAIMHRFHGVEVVAGERSGDSGFRTRGTIVALAKSGIKELADLKGKRMAFGPALGPVSYMSQIDLLLSAGMDPDEDLAYYSIPSGSFKHEKVVYGVLFEKYDAGAVPRTDFDRMVAEGRIAAADFRVLAEAAPIPYCNFAKTQRADDGLSRRLQEALLRLDSETTVALGGEVLRVLERARIDGYAKVADSDFDVVRDMARRTNMPPFQRY